MRSASTFTIPPNIVFPSTSLEGACFGKKKESIACLAAVAKPRGEGAHNKNNQLSLVRNPRFHCTYTAFGGAKERKGVEN